MRSKSSQHEGVNRFLRSRCVASIVSFSVVSAFLFCATTRVAELSAFCVDGGVACSPTGEEKDVARDHHDHGDAEQTHASHAHGSEPTSPVAPKESPSELCCSSLVAVRTNVSSAYEPSLHRVIVQLAQTTLYTLSFTGQLESSGRAHAPPENFSESDRLDELFRSVHHNHAPPSFVVSR